MALYIALYFPISDPYSTVPYNTSKNLIPSRLYFLAHNREIDARLLFPLASALFYLLLPAIRKIPWASKTSGWTCVPHSHKV